LKLGTRICILSPFFFYYLSAHLPKDENTGNSLTSSIFSCADLLNGFGQFQTIINSVHKTSSYSRKKLSLIHSFFVKQCDIFFLQFPPPAAPRGIYFIRIFFIIFLFFFHKARASEYKTRLPIFGDRNAKSPATGKHQRTDVV